MGAAWSILKEAMMASPEYEAGLTTPLFHPITGRRIAGAAAQATRNKMAGGQMSVMNEFAATAVHQFATLIKPLQDTLIQQERTIALLTKQVHILNEKQVDRRKKKP